LPECFLQASQAHFYLSSKPAAPTRHVSRTPQRFARSCDNTLGQGQQLPRLLCVSVPLARRWEYPAFPQPRGCRWRDCHGARVGSVFQISQYHLPAADTGTLTAGKLVKNLGLGFTKNNNASVSLGRILMILEQCTMNSAMLMHRTEIGNKCISQWTTIMNTGRYTSIEEFSGPELCLLDEDHA
jgi:hypothetical protein